MLPVAIFLVAMALLVMASLVLLQQVSRRERIQARIAFAHGGAVAAPTGGSPLQFVASLGAAFAQSGLLSSETLDELEQTLVRAGYRSANGLSVFVGGKLLGMLLMPLPPWILLDGHVSNSLRYIAVAAAAMLGLLLPDLIIRRLRSRYLRRVELGLADALDMLVICAEAGLGLVTAINRVAVEIGAAHPTVSAELATTADELHVIPDPRIALTNMGTRTGLSSLKRLGATLIQSQSYGTPLSQALRTLAAEMRQEMLIKFEERAARLPALLTLPMIVFILPSVFLVVGGPAMIQVMRVLKH